ncbi:MAG: cysteine--tRNA ligase [Nitrospirae bacterium]|nr:cysteine--tRNA ligase [Nitrospirota bacterium]
MTIQIYNTLTGKKEPFEPITPGKAGIYVCGVTVYDLCHIGHARSAIVFDVIRRYLAHRGYAVTYVRNFTDIDDKIINRARQEGTDWKSLAKKYVDAYYEDMALLRVKKADVEPKATDFIREMQEIIGSLVEKGYAYPLPSGVYYRVRQFKGYGKLSKRDPEQMLAGARVEVDETKESPLDFALWKSSSGDEPAWESPWGGGRPGWHIECSAMSLKHLGRTFDIHGGGMDLIFPHHENEIAQSEAYTGKPFARYWMHNGFVNVNQEKMSKSLGNFFTIREIFEKSPYSKEITAEILRYFLLSTHYRSPLDFSDRDLWETTKAALDNFYTLFQRLNEAKGQENRKKDDAVETLLSTFQRQFEEAMDDDFNTAAALAEFQKLRGGINTWNPENFSQGTADKIKKAFYRYGEILGLFNISPEKWQFAISNKREFLDEDLGKALVHALVGEREQARREKNWIRSDEIRKELASMGVILEDRPDGTTRIKR